VVVLASLKSEICLSELLPGESQWTAFVVAWGGHKGGTYDRDQPPLTAGTIEISVLGGMGVASPPV